MRRHLPLNGLRTFEVAARHLSFVKAAAELCVTPTAVSHQIRALEQRLETTLFERMRGRLVLTPSALTVLGQLSAGFDLIEAALAPLDQKALQHRIHVAVPSSVAMLWLLPKLHRFAAAEPDVDVCVHSIVPAFQPELGDNDVLIRSTKFPSKQEDDPNDQGPYLVEHLMSEVVMPVCAPELLAAKSGAVEALLRESPLIHDDSAGGRVPAWSTFFADFDLARSGSSRGLRFTQASLAVEAARRGGGVLLGRSRLVADDVRRGALTPIPAFTHGLRRDYFIVRLHQPRSDRVGRFLRWLASEVAAEDQALPSSFTASRPTPPRR